MYAAIPYPDFSKLTTIRHHTAQHLLYDTLAARMLLAHSRSTLPRPAAAARSVGAFARGPRLSPARSLVVRRYQENGKEQEPSQKQNSKVACIAWCCSTAVVHLVC